MPKKARKSINLMLGRKRVVDVQELPSYNDISSNGIDANAHEHDDLDQSCSNTTGTVPDCELMVVGVEVDHPPQYLFEPLTHEQQSAICEKHKFHLQSRIDYIGTGRELSHDMDTLDVRGDGNCGIRCFSLCISGDEELHLEIRNKLAIYEDDNQEFLKGHITTKYIDHPDYPGDPTKRILMTLEESLRMHLEDIWQPGTYIDDADLICLAAMFSMNVYVYCPPNRDNGIDPWYWQLFTPLQLFSSLGGEPLEPVTIHGSIYLKNTNGNHFEVVRIMDPKTTVPHAHNRYRRQLEQKRKATAEARVVETLEVKSRRLQMANERMREIRAATMDTPEKKSARLERNRLNTANKRSVQTPEEISKRQEKNRLNTANKRAIQTPEKISKRQEQNRLNTANSRAMETPEEISKRQEKDRLNTANSRAVETPEEISKRQEKDRLNTANTRAAENPPRRSERLQKDCQTHANVRAGENIEQRSARLLNDARSKIEKRKMRTEEETIEQNSKRRLKESETLNARRRLYDDSHRIMKIRLQQLRHDMQVRTHHVYKCVSDCRYYPFGSVSKVNLRDAKNGIQRQRKEAIMEHCILSEGMKSYNGEHYICNTCRTAIYAGRIPSTNERKRQFSVPELPPHLQTEDSKLNRLEAHLLKLVVPFIRIVHIPRSAEFKIVGPMICVEADLDETFSKIVPVEQNLIPVALKRRPEYRGPFLEEVVSKAKLRQYYQYFKSHNHLFADVKFEEERIDSFMSENLDQIETQWNWKNAQTASEDGDSNDSEKDPDCDSRDGENEIDVEIVSDNEGHADETYDLPTHLTEIPADTLIDGMTKVENDKHVSGIIANAIIEQENHREASQRKTSRIPKVIVTPTAESKFKYWGTAQYLEEKCFTHLFPTGTGGYLSTHEKKGVGFANYVKHRLQSSDSRFRNDQTYVFFLGMIKEQIELKRSETMAFRKSKVDRKEYTAKFLKSVDKSVLQRSDLGYKVFKNIRGTAPYFAQSKLKVMAMIRQLGGPHLFLTLSAAEAHWKDLIKMLMQKEQNRIVTEKEVDDLTRPEVNKLLTRNVVDTTMHFSSRIQSIFRTMQTEKGLLGRYVVADFFFRIEFQQRGSPHTHSMIWLKDENGGTAPHYTGTEESRRECVELIDALISGNTPEDADFKDMITFFQSHNHTFTCRKKCRRITIREHEGHAVNSDVREGPMLVLNSCRFKFPKYPMRETMIIDAPPPDTEDEVFQAWKRNYLQVRKYIIRQTYEKESESSTLFTELSFDEFLAAVGLSETDYINALRTSIASNRSGSEVFLKRECRDVWINNYNENLLRIHQANMDVSFVLNEYACVSYILGYLTKNESGLSRLLHQIEVESAQFGRTPGEKIKLFSRALDNAREICRSEAIYRMLSLHFTESTRTHRVLQSCHPKNRDGLLKGNVQELEDDEDPFFNSFHDFYAGRSDDLEHLSLAEFARDYRIIYRSKTEAQADELIDDDAAEIEEDENSDDKTTHGETTWIQHKQNKYAGRTRRNNKATVVRYFLPKNNDVELKRSLLVLFVPFRNELAEIHEAPGKSIDQLYEQHKDEIEVVRKQFEPDRNLMMNLEQAMDEMESVDEELDDLEKENEPEEANEGPSENEKDIQHFVALASGPTITEETYLTKKEIVRELIRKLNPDQRRIFDDVMERFVTENEAGDPKPSIPFYLFIAGRAGCGKSFTVTTMIKALEVLFMKSGDDLSKRSVLTIAPTAAAARIVGGDTIEGALKFYRSVEQESIQRFSSKNELAVSFEQLKVLVIDEISMVGSRKLRDIDRQLCDVFGSPRDASRNGEIKRFAGLPIVCTGDFLQLAPVLDKWIFDDSMQESATEKSCTNHWKQNFKMFELTEKMRCLDDPRFAELQDRLGTDSLTDEDVALLKSRVLRCPNEDNVQLYNEGKLAYLVTDNKRKDEINSSKLEILEGEIKVFEAEDIAENFQHNADLIKKLFDGKPYTQTGSLPNRLEVKIGCPVMLTTNLDKADGLNNGTRGYVTDIDATKHEIWVQFPEGIGVKASAIARRKCYFQHRPGTVCIKRQVKSISVRKDSGTAKVKRTQFPLVLSYAITVHKAQGATLDEVIIDFDGGLKPGPGSFYVAVSRVRKLENLYLVSFDPSMVRCNERVRKEIDSMRSHRPYVFWKTPLHYDHFEYTSDNVHDIKITYLNVNGLMLANHILDLDHDVNLKSSDLICISETKLKAEVSDAEIVLSGFTPVSRDDYIFTHQSMGMLVYKRNDSNVNFNVVAKHNSEESKTQVIQVNVNQYKVCFMYIHPTTVNIGLAYLQPRVRPGEFVMGDMNLDYFKQQTKQKIDQFCEDLDLTVSRHGVTHDTTLIDHVLIPNIIADEHVHEVNTFFNFYSDHRSICLRLKNVNPLPH